MNATISGSSSTTRSLAGDNKETGSVAAIYAANLETGSIIVFQRSKKRDRLSLERY